MRKYTKEELVAAMALYNQRAVEHPEEFADYKLNPPEEVAARQVEYLLSLVPENDDQKDSTLLKAAKWDALEVKFDEWYSEESNEEVNLMVIGEMCAEAFGYL